MFKKLGNNCWRAKILLILISMVITICNIILKMLYMVLGLTQEQIDHVIEIVNKGELIFGDFYLLLNLLYFSCFIKNSPSLKNERINRLQYAMDLAYIKLGSIDFNRLTIKAKSHETYMNIVNICLPRPNSTNRANFGRKITAMLVILVIYREILRFYSKRIFWQRSVEGKIKELTTSCVDDLSSLLCKTTEFQDIYKYCIFIETMFANNGIVRRIKERQGMKTFTSVFNEFTEFGDMVYLSTREDVTLLVKNSKNKNGINSVIIMDFFDNMEYIF